MSQKKLQGFTLIELMISMAIIAILATAGLQAYTGYIKKSRDEARSQIASNLNTAVMSYAASNGGNPPANVTAFDTFLLSASEVFMWSSVNTSSGVLLQDPVWGKDVCLDADGNANQPCSFNYTAYTDGTYAISYGIEHPSSTKKNFYKTTASVPPANATANNAAAVPKYGIYVWSAKYIGQPATTTNGTTDVNGVDATYTPPGAPGGAQPLVAVFRSIRVDVPVVSVVAVTNLANGATCTQASECAGGYCGTHVEWYPSVVIEKVCTSGMGAGAYCQNNTECIPSWNCAFVLWTWVWSCLQAFIPPPQWTCQSVICPLGSTCQLTLMWWTTCVSQ